MPPRKQPRSIARELALLSIAQVSTNPSKLEEEDLDSLVLAAVRTLVAEVQDLLENASAEVKRGDERLSERETRTSNLESAKAIVSDAMELTKTAINRLAIAVELPEFIQLTSKQDVREYAVEIISTVCQQRQQIESQIETVLVAWQLNRLPKIDCDILRIAVAEILFLDVPVKVAINEAVELAKRYSDEEGYRFINGVLRRVSDRLKQETIQN